MTTALGKISFLDTPDVNGDSVLTQTDQTQALTNPVFTGTGGLVMPAGTTAQRPTGVAGLSRYNTTLAEPEVYSNGNWLPYARVIQSVAGSITPLPFTGIAAKISTATPTAAPTTSEGAQIFTTSFTPLVVGSNLVIQYTITIGIGALSGTGGTTFPRAMYNAAFVGTTCVGMGTTSSTAAISTIGVNTFSMAMQGVYTTTSTAAVTIQARIGHISTAATHLATMYVNYAGTTATSFTNAMTTEYRILEII